MQASPRLAQLEAQLPHVKRSVRAANRAPQAANKAVDTSWQIGYPTASDVVATLRFSDSTLTISGSGAMMEFFSFDGAQYSIDDSPWSEYAVKSVIIEDGVTSIGGGAFAYGFDITSVSIPNSVRSIGFFAFYGSTGLNKLTIPNSVDSIGVEAFAYCYSLTSMTIPNSVKSIGDGAFSGCRKLESITIPNSVIALGSQMFSQCINLKSVTLPNTLTSIGYAMFYKCSKLASVNIPESVVVIDTMAFRECDSLVSITIPNSVKTIAYGAFYNSGLTSLNLPSSVTVIEAAAFLNCEHLTSAKLSNGLVSIGLQAFRYCISLKSVNIPSSVTSIGMVAFESCRNLQSVTVEWATPLSIPYESAVFRYTSQNFVRLFTPEGKEDLYRAADVWKEFRFENTVSWEIGTPTKSDIIATINFVDSTLTINGSGAMTDQQPIPSNIRSVIKTAKLSDSITSIGYFAFVECENLTSVNIPDSTITIGDAAFALCSRLKSVDLPEGLTTIGEMAFLATGLTSITIPNSVTSVGGWAFEQCYYLTSVSLSNSLTSISNGAFFGCIRLPSIDIPNSVKTLGEGAFQYSISLSSVNLSDSVTYLGKDVFASCYSLKSVVIPESVEMIDTSAFIYCSGLISVSLPGSVDTINYRAFDSCLNLTAITCLAETPPTVDSTAFGSLNPACCLYVPQTALQLYKSADVWQNFTCIQAVETATFTVTFNTNGGTSVDAQTVAVSGKATMPDAPTREGYTFAGWFKESTFVNAWDFETDVVVANITLYAKWTKISALANQSETQELRVFPNPVTNGELTIITGHSRNDGQLAIEIYDLRGKCVYSMPSNSQLSIVNIDISHLANGTYIVRIGTRSAKIVKR